MKQIIYTLFGIVGTVAVGIVSHLLGVSDYWQGVIVGITGCSLGQLASIFAREN